MTCSDAQVLRPLPFLAHRLCRRGGEAASRRNRLNSEDEKEKHDGNLREMILTRFQQQEAEILLQAPEKTELLQAILRTHRCTPWRGLPGKHDSRNHNLWSFRVG